MAAPTPVSLDIPIKNPARCAYWSTGEGPYQDEAVATADGVAAVEPLKRPAHGMPVTSQARKASRRTRVAARRSGRRRRLGHNPLSLIIKGKEWES